MMMNVNGAKMMLRGLARQPPYRNQRTGCEGGHSCEKISPWKQRYFRRSVDKCLERPIVHTISICLHQKSESSVIVWVNLSNCPLEGSGVRNHRWVSLSFR